MVITETLADPNPGKYIYSTQRFVPMKHARTRPPQQFGKASGSAERVWSQDGAASLSQTMPNGGNTLINVQSGAGEISAVDVSFAGEHLD